MKFYIDGVLVKDWDNVPNGNIVDISGDPVNLIFGQERPTSAYTDETADGGFFKGKMDDIMIYNRVLSDDEVLALSEMVVSTSGWINSRNFELKQAIQIHSDQLRPCRFSSARGLYIVKRVEQLVRR